MFIVFDGIDGAGKSTQIKMLVEWLKQQGNAITTCKDPGSTELGEELRAILLNNRQMPIHVRSEMMMFTTARTQLVQQVIKPALAENRIVVLDRYILSTVVYQGHAGDLDPDQIREVNRIATEGLQPDITLVMDLPVDIAMNRLGSSLDRMESRGPEYFEKVREGFLFEVKRSGNAVRVIDATQSVDEIQEQVRQDIGAILAANRDR